MLSKKASTRFTRHLESRFDQFCDYTSIVGFRLLRSENPIWIRLITFIALIGFSMMVFVQTRDAFQRFLDPTSKPVPRFEASQTAPIPRPGIIICTEKQIASVLRGYGSLDFRLLLFEYIKEEPTPELFLRVEQEYRLLKELFNSSEQFNEARILEARKQLQHFPEISSYLNFESLKSNPNVLLQLPNYQSFSTLQSELDDCWIQSWQDSDKKAGKLFLLDISYYYFLEFIRCRWEKAKKLFEEFGYFNQNFFEYHQNVSLKFEDLVLEANFYKTDFTHEQIWKIDYGPCELLKPNDNAFDESEIDEKIFDTLTLRTNFFESRPDASTTLFLYDSMDGKIMNRIELVSGEYLEIELAGFSEMANELCQNYYSSMCERIQKIDTNYSWNGCRWCETWAQVCDCAVPEYYHKDVILRNCTFFEAANCTQRYRQAILQQTTCQSECRTTNYILNTRQQALELEMMSLEFESRINQNYQKLTWEMNNFKQRPRNSNIRL